MPPSLTHKPRNRTVNFKGSKTTKNINSKAIPINFYHFIMKMCHCKCITLK